MITGTSYPRQEGTVRLNRTPNTGLEDIKLVAFDLDDTLAPSKSALDPTMARLLVRLAELVPVCIISGGSFEQFRSQVLAGIEELREITDTGGNGPISRFHLMPLSGTQYYAWTAGHWLRIYSEGHLARSDKEQIVQVLTDGAKSLGLWESQTWGPIIEDRGSQITFSALGQAAPVERKTAWDPRGDKKEKLRAYAAERLPRLEVRSGGSTSVDVTRKGIDKAYGMKELINRLGITRTNVLFVGDRLDVGGNDYPVKAMGIRCVAVENWRDTAIFIRGMIQTFTLGEGRSGSA
jgi:phosphomannomutase